MPYRFFADRPLFAVTLQAGDRKKTLSVGNLYAGVAHGRTPEEERKYCDCRALLDRAYTLPLGDPSWPDDTRVELQYMQPAPAEAGDPYAAFIGSTKADVRAAFGDAKVLTFGNGHEVWAYDFGPPQQAPLQREELVLLFDRSDRLVAERHRK